MTAASAVALVVPALAQDPGAGIAPAHRPGMMSHDMTRGGMMSGGCGGMMQSMAGGDGRPNSQWRTHRPDSATPD